MVVRFGIGDVGLIGDFTTQLADDEPTLDLDPDLSAFAWLSTASVTSPELGLLPNPRAARPVPNTLARQLRRLEG
jgi:hypothetical protein